MMPCPCNVLHLMVAPALMLEQRSFGKEGFFSRCNAKNLISNPSTTQYKYNKGITAAEHQMAQHDHLNADAGRHSWHGVE